MKLDFPWAERLVERILPYVRVLPYLFILMLFFFLPYRLLIYPKFKEIRNYQDQLKIISADISNANKLRKEFVPPTQEEKEEWEKLKKKLYSSIPKDKDFSRAVEEIARLMHEADIHRNINISFLEKETSTSSDKGKGGPTLTLPTDSHPVSSVGSSSSSSSLVSMAKRETKDIGGELDIVTIVLTFRSPYENLAYFLGRLRQTSLLMEIESFEVKKNFPVLDVSMRIVAFYWIKKGII